MDNDAADDEDFHVQQDDYFHKWTEWNDDGRNDDGAYVHYYSEDDVGAAPIKTAVQAHGTPLPRGLDSIPEDRAVPGPCRVNRDLPPAPEPPKKKTRRKKATGEESDVEATIGKDIAQEELNAKLKDAILKNETLYHRILRYEPKPIHFDVFMELATDLGIPAKRSGLKGKVRAFLDQKAIHFYGADPTKSRTRRIRHP